MGNSKTREEKDFDDPLAVIANANARMPTRRLLEDFIKVKILWQPEKGIISKGCFKDISHIFQKEGVISPANSEVLEKCNELFSRKVRSSSSLSDLHWKEICKRGGFQIGGRIIQLLGYPFRVPLFSGLIWVFFGADNSWTVWFWIIGLILACFLPDYIFTTSCYCFFPSRAVVVRDSPDGSAGEPSIAQDIPPPDHDQSCNSQPHYEEDLNSSSSNDSPDGSAEEPSIAQDIPPPDHDQSCDLQVISPANSEVLEQRNDIFFGEESTSSSSSSDDSPDGSTEEPSIAQDIPPPDHDQSCNSQPHYEEDLNFSSSSNDSPDGSTEELSNTQNVQRYKEDFIKIGEPIGEGGFGKVFKVQHRLDKKHYAIKKIKVTKIKSCFLQREITTLALLDHPNVVRYHQSWYETEFQQVSQPPLQDLGSLNGLEEEDDGEEEEEEEEGNEQEGVNSCLYIQMELCSGSLRRWLKDRIEMKEKENLDIFKQMLEGTNYIHSQGIVHRDLTPKNIFLINKDDGHPLVKIGDFGLAREYVVTEPKTPMRFQRDQDLDKSSVDPDVSQTYTSGIGTETYAAPEQLKGGEI